MSNEEFDELKKNKGGLIAFNSFLSTSSDKDVSLAFAQISLDDPDVKALFYVIEIDPNLLTLTPVAYLGEDHSHFSAEKEYLWSMNAIFRIGGITEVEKDLWQVSLMITSDDDPQLRQLTEYMKKEAGTLSGMERLGNLMIDMGEWSKAKDIYDTLRKNGENIGIYSQLAFIAYRMSELDTALQYYQDILVALSEDPTQYPHSLASVHSNMGGIFMAKNLSKKARKHFQQALDLERNVEEPIEENIVSNLYRSICPFLHISHV